MTPSQKNHRSLKNRVMKKYGGTCKGCGTNELTVLTIDHINDDGARKRKSKQDSSGRAFYLQLVKEARRRDLQILCANCQLRKQAGERLPAKIEGLDKSEEMRYTVVIRRCHDGPR